MKRLLMLSADPNDGTSWWRSRGPFSDLVRRAEGEWEFMAGQRKFGWADLAFFDVVFFQRPWDRDALKLCRLIKAMGLRLWLDYDDDLLAVPPSNPAWRIYRSKDVQQTIMQMQAMADIVTVSTRPLASVIGQVNPSTVVVPNAWDDRVLRPWRNPSERKYQNVILWRGSPTHAEDVEQFVPAIEELAKERPDWRWAFLGDCHWGIHKAVPPKQLVLIDPLDMPDYFHFFQAFDADIGIVPLVRSPFNAAKSTIGWMELSYAGAACVTPSWDEWEFVPSEKADDAVEFKRSVSRLMNDPGRRAELRDSSVAKITKLQSLSLVNLARHRILDAFNAGGDILKTLGVTTGQDVKCARLR